MIGAIVAYFQHRAIAMLVAIAGSLIPLRMVTPNFMDFIFDILAWVILLGIVALRPTKDKA